MDSQTHARIIEILDQTDDMTIATIRPDGFPQATVVAFVHDDLKVYFSTFPASQKVQNIAEDDKVSLTITKPYSRWQDIESLSVGGHAHVVDDPEEARLAGTLILERYPEIADVMAGGPGDPVIVRIDPAVISLIDYSKGFGHTELVDVQGRLTAA
jgi:nitroimidazol reductase NimA-like FMN-containing flavoprotein (pyridoxamine 5'-phosphate oxidase superfamily)